MLASIPTGSAAPTFTFAAPTGSFYVRMHALNGAFRSAASNEIRIHVNVPVAPSAPANLLGLVNGSTLALAWTNTYAGGAPTSLVLDVTGAIAASVPLGLDRHLQLRRRARRDLHVVAAGAERGRQQPVVQSRDAHVPRRLLWSARHTGRRRRLPRRADRLRHLGPRGRWSGADELLLDVTGAFVGGFATTGRALSGTVGPGSYTLSVIAVNPCGASAGSPPQTVVVP